MDKFINSLPKPVLAIGAIAIGIVVFMLISPPHTVCDTQAETLKESLKGVLFPNVVNKKKIPATLARTKEACQLGNSPGSCYEYFSDLKRIADEVAKASTQCTQQLYNLPEVAAAMNDGIELMVRLAWGTQPPDVGFARFGWMQEAEIATFCRLKSLYLRAHGETAWTAVRGKIFAKLPGEPPKMGADDPSLMMAEPKRAVAIMSEKDIWDRSLFSVRCESFL